MRRIFFVVAMIGLAGGAHHECCGQSGEVNPPTRSREYTSEEFTSSDGTKLAYWLMKPASAKPNKTYPLVLTLHGRGGNTVAATVLAATAMKKKHPCFVIAPAVSRKEVWAVPAGFRRLPGEQRIAVALELVEAVKRAHPVDPTRVYVTGQSMGGFGTFGAIATSPRTFAAAIPVCGGWTPDDAEKMKHIPLWVFHGGADRTVPVDRSRKMVEAIKEAGGAPKYTEYPKIGHNSWSRTYASAETWDWLFAQRTSK